MKWDMAGSAAVIGVMEALAARRAKVNAVGVVGLVENMPSANAQRPSDIVKSMSGRTIEVLNTDAEGRLVLADIVWYTQDRFKPKVMIDLATLTGAIIVALGNEYAGLYANNEDLAKQLTAAGTAVGEKLWRMPLGEAYDRDIDSEAADVKNIGSQPQWRLDHRRAVHPALRQRHGLGASRYRRCRVEQEDAAITPKGATAFGVRLLERFVAEITRRSKGVWRCA